MNRLNTTLREMLMTMLRVPAVRRDGCAGIPAVRAPAACYAMCGLLAPAARFRTGAVLLTTLVLLAGCVSRPDVNVTLIGLAPVESTLFEQRLRVDFRLQNFSDQVIRATGFSVALDVNGRRLARGVDDGSLLLTGLSETTASAVVSTSLFDVARQLLDISTRESFDYELSGRLYLDGWPRSVSFTRTGEISREELRRLVGGDGREPQPLTLQ